MIYSSVLSQPHKEDINSIRVNVAIRKPLAALLGLKVYDACSMEEAKLAAIGTGSARTRNSPAGTVRDRCVLISET